MTAAMTNANDMPDADYGAPLELERKGATLRYALSDFVLFRKTFSLMVGHPRYTGEPQAVDVERLWRRVPPDADGLVLRSCPVAEEPARLTRLPGMLRYVPATYDRFYAELSGTFEEYLGRFGKKSRYKLKRMVRQFDEHTGGEGRWRAFRTPGEMAEWYAAARALSKQTYQERLLDAGLPEGKAFERELAERAGRDAVRAYLLYSGGRGVAYVYCTVSGDVVEYNRIGYDPDFRDLSPGTVLAHHMMESLFAEGRFRLFDFGQGGGVHKERFATGSTRCADLYYFRPTLRNRLLLRLHAGIDALSEGVGRLLERLNLKSAIRRAIRST